VFEHLTTVSFSQFMVKNVDRRLISHIWVKVTTRL